MKRHYRYVGLERLEIFSLLLQRESKVHFKIEVIAGVTSPIFHLRNKSCKRCSELKVVLLDISKGIFQNFTHYENTCKFCNF